jgi:hypothetical protein
VPYVDSLSYRGRPCLSPAPKNKSVLVACSLVRYARHTQTVNLYAPLTLRFTCALFGLTHGRPCPQVWSGGRLAGPRCRSCLPYACVYVSLGRGQHGLVSRRSARAHELSRRHGVAARSARPPRSYRMRHRRLELWTPPQEPATRAVSSARHKDVAQCSKSRRRDLVYFCLQAHGWKGRVYSFPSTIPRLLNPTTRPSGPLDRPGLESRSETLDIAVAGEKPKTGKTTSDANADAVGDSNADAVGSTNKNLGRGRRLGRSVDAAQQEQL